MDAGIGWVVIFEYVASKELYKDSLNNKVIKF
jgi:hypothetical protein